MTVTINALTAEYEAWLDANDDLPMMSADELSCEVAASMHGESTLVAASTGDADTRRKQVQIKWLGDFIQRWECAEMEDAR